MSIDYVLYIHFILYCFTFYKSYNISLNGSVLYPIICGWSLFGLLSVGHDKLHKSKTRFNRIMAFCCLDLFTFNSTEWIYYHNKIHHCNLKSKEDFMGLHGDTFISEFYNLIYTHIFRKNTERYTHIVRIPYYILLFRLRWYQIILIYIALFSCAAYFTYITHIHNDICFNDNGNNNNGNNNNDIIYILNNTIDIYPNSHICGFLMGGFNAHATHHCFPTCNRSNIYEKSLILKNKYPNNYKCINNIVDLYKLYWNREI